MQFSFKDKGTQISILLSCMFCLFFTHAKGIQAVVMKNVFYAPSGSGFSPYLEAYWQIDPQSLLFSREGGVFQGKIHTHITIAADTGTVREERYLLTTNPIADGAVLYQQNIIDLRRYELAAGRYTLRLELTDEFKPESSFLFTDSFTVAPLTKPTLSDIQFVDTIIISNEENIFSRNGHLQIPLCANFFDEHRLTLHYYAELYQPGINNDSEFLILSSHISKKPFDPPVNRLAKRDTLKPALVHVIEDKMKLHTLASGNYYLNLVIYDDKQEQLSSKTAFLQLLNPNPEALSAESNGDTSVKGGPVEVTTVLNLNKTFLGKYTPAQIRAILKMLIPIAEPNERTSINGFLNKPDDMYTRYFIYNFWLKRDKLKPESAWKEYADKVKQVNKLFGSSLLPGYESERGLIYLKYGAPTERIVINNESNAFPYEIWQYNSLPNTSNALFLFYRPGLVTNDYRLLHSTVNGEIRNRNWRSLLYIDGNSDVNSSRAEQYIGNR